MIPRVSLHRVSSAGGRLRTLTGEEFRPLRYSGFKYGDAAAAEHYASGLSHRLWDSGLLSWPDRPVLTTAPYKSLPTASYELALHVREHLNAGRPAGSAPVEIVPLHLRHVDAGNYSAQSQDERQQIMDEAGLHLGAGDVTGRQVVLVDDAVVSGTAESRAVEILLQAGASGVVGAYAVEVDRASALAGPEIEDALNHAYVKDLGALLEIYTEPSAVLNIRTVKYVLDWPDPAAVERFFERIHGPHLIAFHKAVLQTGDAFAASYPAGVAQLRAVVSRRGLE
ncbi:MAG TPA: phosphoribosyltransferase family protein [Mycobacteriales bacterium]|nr:phosphoribosyltransferase family protein [Mycobacteriales bacterium]